MNNENFEILERGKNLILVKCLNKNIKEAVIPDGVTSIERNAFYYCSSLEKVIIPDSVKEIGDEAFHNCISLKTINLPNKIRYINRNTFCGCTFLDNVIIPNSVISIGEGAFMSCKNLKTIALPKELKFLKKQAFAYCDSLESVNIPDSVTSIGEAAFEDCKNLKSVTLSNSIKIIKSSIFRNCKSLEKIKIPELVNTIESRAFEDCENLRSISMPKGLIKIKEFAFNCCKSLENVVIPKSVTVLEDKAFDNCPLLKNVTMPKCFDFRDYKIFLYANDISFQYYEDTEEDKKPVELHNFEQKPIFEFADGYHALDELNNSSNKRLYGKICTNIIRDFEELKSFLISNLSDEIGDDDILVKKIKESQSLRNIADAVASMKQIETKRGKNITDIGPNCFIRGIWKNAIFVNIVLVSETPFNSFLQSYVFGTPESKDIIFYEESYNLYAIGISFFN